MDERNTKIHLNHCNQGDYEDSCKYGDEDCPAIFHTTTRYYQTTDDVGTDVKLREYAIRAINDDIQALEGLTFGYCPTFYLTGSYEGDIAAADKLRMDFDLPRPKDIEDTIAANRQLEEDRKG
jgi:hypothetical protein